VLARCDAEVRTYRARSLEAMRVVHTSAKRDCGDWTDTRHCPEPMAHRIGEGLMDDQSMNTPVLNQ
jgi:hypothetical protein